MSRTIPFAERHRLVETVTGTSHVTVEAPAILGADGRPARLPRNAACPHCGAGADQRVKSGGFGIPHETCQRCAFEFPE